MKIALINENSQAAKNEMICATLKKVVEPMGHEVFNYGMCGAEDPNSLTYVQNGIRYHRMRNRRRCHACMQFLPQGSVWTH